MSGSQTRASATLGAAADGLRFLSVCSGVEAASLAWGPLGWKAAAFSQFDPEHNYARGPDFPSRVLAHRFPDVSNLGDLTKFEEWPDDLKFDLLCGGTPCQSFSMAGKRGGMADPRGRLSLSFVGVARRYRPQWVVWENVPGALTAERGEAFRSIVGALAELGYGLAWRVLDAQHFGVPQRRKRLVLVGYLGDPRPACAVLFESDSLRRDPPSRGKTRKGSTPPLMAALQAVASSEPSTRSPQPASEPVAPTTIKPRPDTSSPPSPRKQVARRKSHTAPPLTGTVSSKWAKGTGGPSGDEFQNLISFDATQVTCPTNRSRCEPGDPSPSLAKTNAIHIAFSCKDHGADAGEISPTLRAMGHGASHQNGGGQVAVAFALRGRDEGAVPEVHGDGSRVGALRAANGGSSRDYVCATGEVTHTLTAEGFDASEDGTGRGNPIVGADAVVRRLTPRECERLQDMPDDHTRIPVRTYKAKPKGKHFAKYPDLYERNADGTWTKFADDGPRYKAIGNSWAVCVFRWVGERIDFVRSVQAEMAAAAGPAWGVEQTEVGPQLTIFPPAPKKRTAVERSAPPAPISAVVMPAVQPSLFGDADLPRVKMVDGEPMALAPEKRARTKPSAKPKPPSQTGAKRASFEASIGPRRIKPESRLMGSIGQGAAPAEERGLDLYESDPNAVRALAREWGALKGPRLVWEPACGPGVIVRTLRDAGHLVIATDVEDYGDRMPERAAVQNFFAFDSAPEGADLIVTNPPYLHADRFVEHALKLAPTCAMLLRLAYVQGIGRSRIIDRHLSELLIFRDRLAMMHRDGFEGPKISSSAIPFAWFVFERDHATPGEWRSRRIWAQPEKAWKAERAAGGLSR